MKTSKPQVSELISSTGNHLEQWRKKNDWFCILHNISEEAISSSIEKKDKTQKLFNDFIYQQCFDSLNGGLITINNNSKSENKYCKSLQLNLYISELLVAADQVFYQGDFYHLGKNIIQFYIREFELKSSSLLKYHKVYNLNNLPCFYTEKQLTSTLTNEENELLRALVGVENNGCIVSYKQNLRDASESIGMHYKQAQILEYSIQQKLNAMESMSKNFSIESIENYYLVNCELIVSATKLLLNHNNDSVLICIRKIFDQLVEVKDKNSSEQYIDLLYAGINLLQLDFSLLNNIRKLIIDFSKMDLDLSLHEQNESHLHMIYSFIHSINYEQIIDYFEIDMKLSESFYKKRPHLAPLKIIFLKRSYNLDKNLTKLKSKFNPLQLIYVV